MIAQDFSAQSAEQAPSNYDWSESAPVSEANQLPGKVTGQVQSLKGNDFAKRVLDLTARLVRSSIQLNRQEARELKRRVSLIYLLLTLRG